MIHLGILIHICVSICVCRPTCMYTYLHTQSRTHICIFNTCMCIHIESYGYVLWGNQSFWRSDLGLALAVVRLLALQRHAAVHGFGRPQRHVAVNGLGFMLSQGLGGRDGGREGGGEGALIRAMMVKAYIRFCLALF